MRRSRLPPGPHPDTVSRRALVAYLGTNSQLRLEAQSGVPQSSLSAYVLQRARPDRESAKKLAAVVPGCTADGWTIEVRGAPRRAKGAA